MNAEQATELVADVIGQIAPEADLELIDPDEPFVDELDLDSIDLLAFVSAVNERTGIDIPETDLDRSWTLPQAIAYLVAHGPD